MRNKTVSARLHILILGVVIIVVGVACTSTGNDNDVIAPAPVDSETYTIGQTVYNNQCAECHGINGEGQFPDAPLQPDDTGRIGAPPHDSTGHTWHHDDDLLLRYVREGGLGDPSRFYPMPGFADVLNDEEIVAVLAYIKTMWSPQEVAVQRERTIAIREQQQ